MEYYEAEATESSEIIIYTYNDLGQVLTETVDSNGTSHATSYRYDRMGRTSSVWEGTYVNGEPSVVSGELGARHDGFGHIEYGASENTAVQQVANYLNRHGLKARGQATCQQVGVMQRDASIYASKVDIEEAVQVGRKAVEIAIADGTGFMATILRRPGGVYVAYYDKVPLRTVANSVRYLPRNWIASGGLDVTDDFIRYAMPLIGDGWPDVPMEGGLQSFARLDLKFKHKKLPTYTPCRW